MMVAEAVTPREHGVLLGEHRRGGHAGSAHDRCEHCRFPQGGPLQRATLYTDLDPHVMARQGWRDRVAAAARQHLIDEHRYGKHKTIRWGCDACEVGALKTADEVAHDLAAWFNPLPADDVPAGFTKRDAAPHVGRESPEIETRKALGRMTGKRL